MGTDPLNLLAHLPDGIENLKVLNLGAGYCSSVISAQFLTLPFKELHNVEIWPAAFLKLAHLQFKAQRVHNYNEEALSFVINTEETYDVVVMIDFFEHLMKMDAMLLLNRCRKISPFVVMFLPIGLCEQDDLDGNPYQKHSSTWILEDFTGAKVELYEGMHKHFLPPVDAAWVIYDH